MVAVSHAVAIGTQVNVVALPAKGAQARLAMPSRAKERVLELSLVIGREPVIKAELRGRLAKCGSRDDFDCDSFSSSNAIRAGLSHS